VQPEQDRRPTPEGLLLDYARRLARHRPGRRALWFHLSQLERQNRHEADLQLAVRRLTPLAQQYLGEVFQLSSGDIVVCLKDPNLREIESAVMAIRFSFARDPLMKRADTDGTQVFVTAFDMTDQYDAFIARAVAAANGELAESVSPVQKLTPGLGERLMLSREELEHRPPPDSHDGHIQTSQGRIAIERMLETRRIATFDVGRAREWGVRLTVRIEAVDAFDALSMAIARHQIEPEAALGEVERVLLSAIGEHVRSQGRQNQILVLHAEALMSPEFLLFDRNVTALKEGKPRLFFQPEELRERPDTITYLKSFLTARGFELGLAGLALPEVAELERGLSNLRLIEIDHPREIEVRDAEMIKRLLARFGPEGVILSGLQTQKALVIARRAGVRLFSGPIIEEAL